DGDELALSVGRARVRWGARSGLDLALVEIEQPFARVRISRNGRVDACGVVVYEPGARSGGPPSDEPFPDLHLDVLRLYGGSVRVEHEGFPGLLLREVDVLARELSSDAGAAPGSIAARWA